MSNRIDIESMEARMRLWAIGDVSDEDLALELDYIVPELKRMYAREAELLDALRVIRDDLQEARAYGAYTLAQSEKLRKIGNFANDASQ